MPAALNFATSLESSFFVYFLHEMGCLTVCAEVVNCSATGSFLSSRYNSSYFKTLFDKTGLPLSWIVGAAGGLSFFWSKVTTH